MQHEIKGVQGVGKRGDRQSVEVDAVASREQRTESRE
jgi:hypothetical protein